MLRLVTISALTPIFCWFHPIAFQCTSFPFLHRSRRHAVRMPRFCCRSIVPFTRASQRDVSALARSLLRVARGLGCPASARSGSTHVSFETYTATRATTMRRALVHARAVGGVFGRAKEALATEAVQESVASYHAGASSNEHVGMRGTTVLCVRKGDQVVMMADGQVTLGSEILKPNVRKVRRIGDNVIGGFAGATADAFTLFERLEHKLDEHPGQLTRAAVELAKLWRTDKFLRRLDAVMVVADKTQSLQITGNGDVLEPHDGVIGIGSGGSYAVSAARALIDVPDMDALQIAKKAMKVAADICIYTNHNFVTETIGVTPEAEKN